MMSNIKVVGLLVLGVGIGSILTNPAGLPVIIGVAAKISSKIFATGIIATLGSLIGGVYGASKGVQVGQSCVKPGDGAFQIPIGFIFGGLAGSVIGGSIAFTASLIIL